VKRILQIAVIAALTVFFLWLFLRNANLREVGAILSSTAIHWVLIGLAANLGALILRTIRWRTLLDPDDPPPFYATFFANAVGYMTSIVLPIRASDFARPVLLSRRTSHRISGALGTILTERILDLTSILLMFVIFAALRWNEFSHDPDTAAWFYIVRAGAIASAVILTALWSFMIGLRISRETVRRLHEWLGRFLPRRIRESWMHFFDTFTETLRLTQNPRVLVKVLLCTIGTWTCLTSQFWFATMAVHQRLPYDASFFVTGVTTVGLAIPTPGGIGGFHKACQLVLTRFYGFTIDSSVAVAVLFHVIGTLPVLTIGLFLFAKEGLSLKQLRGEGGEKDEEGRMKDEG
jgi:glycosyltransferase 2 family protein